jgi:excisionase family DNA binding protein
MKYLNAMQAARAIGCSDKTVRNWIRDGKLTAVRTPSNRLGIPESEVSEMRRQYLQFSQPNSDVSEKLNSLEQRIATLEHRIAALEQEKREATMGKGPDVSASMGKDTAQLSRAQKRLLEPSESISQGLPVGSMRVVEFAAKYGISRSTVMHHVQKGIAGERLETIEKAKPSRPGQSERWLTPDLQEKALQFWQRYGVRYSVSERDT